MGTISKITRSILTTLGMLPSPALGPGQLETGDLVIAQDVPAIYWVNGDGTTIPRSLVQVGGGAIITSAVDIYVNSATGSDSNPGTVAALPVATIAQAYRLANLLRSTVATTIHIQNAATYVQPADEVLNVPIALGSAMPLRMVGVKEDSGLGAITATGGTSGGLSPVAAGTITGAFPAGAFNKKYGTWIKGANIGKRFAVISNDAGTIKCAATFSPAPAAGDEFTIESSGSAIQGTNTLTFNGGALLLDTLTLNPPQSTGVRGGITFTLPYVQENAVSYLALAGASFPSVEWGTTWLQSGLASWGAGDPSVQCGCVYDGTATAGGELFVNSGPNIRWTNPVWDTVGYVAGKALATINNAVIAGVGSVNNCSFGITNNNTLYMVGLLCSNLVASSSFTGIGIGCIAARGGSVVQSLLCDFQNCAAGVPIVSLDQAKGVLASLTGTNAASSLVLSELSHSSCEVTGLTVTDSTGFTSAQIGGTAGTTVISGVIANTNDLAAAANSQLCLVGPPT